MLYKKRLIDARQAKKLYQKDISKFLSIGPYTYGHYEREETIIPIKQLIKVCDYLECSIDYLFNFSNQKQYNNYKEGINSKLMGKRLKEFRKGMKFTQAKLATIIGTTPTVISGYESGRRIIATSFLYDICKKYNISADYLLGKIDSPKNI